MLTREKLINRVLEVMRHGTPDDKDEVLLEVWKFLTKDERHSRIATEERQRR